MDVAEQPNPLQFPRSFRWGVATSAYQIEGGWDEGGKSPSIWDVFTHEHGRIADGSTGDRACESYPDVSADLTLLRELGVNAYRFSISWPRFQPQGRGAVNATGLAYYERLIDGLLAAGIEPWVTLYHWDLPLVLEKEGGWPCRDTPHRFAEYAYAVATHLGDRVAGWITINEPWVSSVLGYGVGLHAPGKTDINAAFAAAHHQLLAHGLGVQALRSASRASVGLALSLTQVDAVSSDPLDELACRVLDGHHNRWFLDPVFGRGYPEDMLELYGARAPTVLPGDFACIAEPIDFLGVNYYSRQLVRAPRHDTPLEGVNAVLRMAGFPLEIVPEIERQSPWPLTAMGWEVYPKGLSSLLERLAKTYQPKSLVITETGAAYEDAVRGGVVDDFERQRFLQAHIYEAQTALSKGVPLDGLFVWSLMDNFEWAEGFRKRFGLAYTNFSTLERQLKTSGRWYGEFVRAARAL